MWAEISESTCLRVGMDDSFTVFSLEILHRRGRHPRLGADRQDTLLQ